MVSLVSISINAPVVRGQAASKFKNIQVMKGMSDGAISKEMAAWNKQLGIECIHCHVEGNFASEEKPEKVKARTMFQIVSALNKDFFNKDPLKDRKADCFLCHKGAAKIPAEAKK